MTRPARAGSEQLDEVRRLTSDNPDQQARLHALETLINEDFGGFAASRAAAERDRAGREPLALLMEHKRTMDAARALLAGMEAEEARLDRLRERDATWRWGLTAALLIGGALAFAFAAARMTVRSRLAEIRRARAEEEQRLLQGVFAGIDDGITLLDRRGKLIFANAAAARMIGFDSPAALMAAPSTELLARFEILDEAGCAAAARPAAFPGGVHRQSRSPEPPFATGRGDRARGAGRSCRPIRSSMPMGTSFRRSTSSAT